MRFDFEDLPQKELKDFRDRAAFLYLTGVFPTHLRDKYTRMLVQIARHPSGCSILDAKAGVFALNDAPAIKLDLENHVMVRKVHDYEGQGWTMVRSRGPNARRSYKKIFMKRGAARAVVQSDGSVLDDWE